MRGIFFTLLLLNLVYFFYNQSFFTDHPSVSSDKFESYGVKADPSAARTLVLLSEKGVGVEDQEGAEEALFIDQSELSSIGGLKRLPVKSGSFCPVIGPFKSRSAVNLFEKAWGQQAFKTKVAELQKKATVKYWLKAKAPGSPEQKLVLARKLQSLGYEGYILGSGPQVSEVVAGIYASREEAERAKALLKEEAIAAYFDEKREVLSEFWLKVISQVAYIDVENSLKKVLPDHRDIFLTQSLCE